MQPPIKTTSWPPIAMRDRVAVARSTLADRAADLNDGVGDRDSRHSLQLLADLGWLGLGIPEAIGGAGGTRLEAIEAIAHTAEDCLTSGFVFWCQRAFAEYLAASDNPWLQRELLPAVVRAERFGATGLSNAMKHLAGIESLRVRARWQGDRLHLNGYLPWASNLVPGNFVVAVAAETEAGEAIVAAVPADAPGLGRSDDLELLGLRGSNTAALTLDEVTIDRAWVISDRAREFLPAIRPSFLLLQCGLGLGVARSALRTVRSALGDRPHILRDRFDWQAHRYDELAAALGCLAALADFGASETRQLFRIRIALTRLAVEAIGLELEAQGGAAYLTPSRTARRWREVAFLPVLTPSLVQLETELARYTDDRADRTPQEAIA
jgi:alkylation response protein AidB-like acyl-CoA dehydrogenase